MSMDQPGMSGIIGAVRTPDCLFENASSVFAGTATEEQKDYMRNRDDVRGNMGQVICARTGCLRSCVVKIDRDSHIEVLKTFDEMVALGEGCPVQVELRERAEPGEPAVQPPNDAPTGSRFDTSTETYVSPSQSDVQDPQWLLDEADRMARERGDLDASTKDSPEL